MVAAATRLFAERGFHDVSMEEIADQVGITKPMLYAYFGSKEGLHAACIERALGPLAPRLEAAVDPALPLERQLWHGLLAFFSFVAQERELWAQLYVAAGAQGGAASEQVARVRDQLHATLSTLLRRAALAAGVRSRLLEEIDSQAAAPSRAAEALAAEAAHEPFEAEMLARRLMNFAWRGFEALLDERIWRP